VTLKKAQVDLVVEIVTASPKIKACLNLTFLLFFILAME
jgi:hypothetical protein